MNNLSVIILTKNEEETIGRAITSVSNISNDIVIVDSGSTDKTLKIAELLGAKFLNRRLDGFASQRNFANKNTKNNWVLSMDSDEEIPIELAMEISETIKNPSASAFLIPRRNIIFGKEIKHTRWSPDMHIWLYNKNEGTWSGDVHEEWICTSPIGVLNNAKIHHSYKTVTGFVDMINRYTEIESERLFSNGEHFSLFRMFYFSIRSFVGRFIFKLGFLDGYYGFVLSVLMSFYRLVTWIKLWEREQND